MKNYNRTILLFFCTLFLAHLSNGQQIITLDEPESGNQNHEACELVNLLPGYQYAPGSTTKMHAFISNDCPPAYTDVEELYPFYYQNHFDIDLDNSKDVGATEGNLSVDLNGAAVYAIPLILPPATNQIGPDLSVVYNSNGGSDMLGKGWNLQGISAITRIGKNLFQDKKTTGIALNNNDQFALDNQRMIKLSTNTYGLVENDFSEITAQGSSGSGPEWFEVESKLGMVMEFGKTADARLFANNNSDIIAWQLNRVIDKFGNYVDYKYTEIDGQQVLDKILYTGNATAGISPYNEVNFFYGLKTDTNTKYVAGTPIHNKLLLEKIVVLAEGLNFKTFDFNYGYDVIGFFPGSVNTHLTSIQETGSDGNQKNKTIFDYGFETLFQTCNDIDTYCFAATSTNNPTGLANVLAEYRPADFNGDGFTDFIAFTYDLIQSEPIEVRDYQNWRMFVNDGDGTYTQTVSNGILPPNFTIHDLNLEVDPNNNSTLLLRNSGVNVIDVNGDGMEDVILANSYQGNTNYTPYISTGNNLIADGAAKLTVNLAYTYFSMGDFNGDGRIDAFAYNPSNDLYKVHFFGLGNGLTINKSIDFQNTFENSRILPIDLEGDGTTELLYWKDYLNLRVLKFNTTEYFDANGDFVNLNLTEEIIDPDFNYNPLGSILSGDFNGDGKTDLMTHSASGWIMRYNDGLVFSNLTTDLLPEVSAPSDIFRKQNVRDVNGDGLSDLIEMDDYRVNVYLSQGNGFVKKIFSNVQTNSWDGDARVDFVDHDGDGRSEIYYRNSSGNKIINLFQFSGHNNLEHVVDGYGKAISIDYEPLTNEDIYSKGIGGTYPVIDLQVPYYVVSSTTSSSPIGIEDYLTEYAYEGLRIHRRGKGFLGFKKIISENVIDGRKQIQEFDFDSSFYVPFITKNSQRLSDNSPVMSSTFQYEFDDIGGITNSNIFYPKQFFRRLVGQEETNSVSNYVKTVDIVYDNFGNPISQTENIDGGLEIHTTTSTWSSAGTIYPSKKTSQTSTVLRQGESAYTRSVNYEYNYQGALDKIVSDQGSPEAVTTDFSQFNAFGLPEKTVISASGVPSKISQITFDSKGKYVVEKTNELGQSTSYVQSPLWGSPLATTDFTGRTQYATYDGFGNLVTSTDGFGIVTTHSINWISTNPSITGQDPFDADDLLFERVKSKEGQPFLRMGYNRLGMKRMMTTQGHFENTKTVMSYNARGENYKKTNPFFEGTPDALVTTSTFDNFGRILSTTNGTHTSSYTYNIQGTTVKTTVSTTGSAPKSITLDATGKTIAATDAGGDMLYDYYSNGKMKSTLLNEVEVASATYDLSGNQTSISDPNAGTSTFDFDNFGTLTEQVDGNANTFTFTFDVIGRPLTKTGPEGEYIYEYVSSGNGLNQVKKITAPNGIYKEFIYDGDERIEEVKEFVDGALYSSKYEYDDYGRNTRMVYPGGFAVQKFYSATGFLDAVTSDDGLVVLWSAQEQNVFGAYNKYTLGNNIQSVLDIDEYGRVASIQAGSVQHLNLDWDDVAGNLESREDVIKGRTEIFGYDNQHRLSSYEVLGSDPNTVQFSPIGNIAAMTSIGDYSYDATKVNAVTEVENIQGVINPSIQNIQFNSFHKPTSIEEAGFELGFTYGIDEMRKLTEFFDNDVLVETRIFIEGYEKSLANGNTTEVHYIHGGSGLAAIYVEENGTGNYYYPYMDHLGSILTLTDDQGEVIFEQNFDPWGRKRNPDTWTYAAVPESPSWLWRGYTGHEQLDKFQLINMNGRIYDPTIGRMLSPDNFVADATSSQNYNRYTYANNNPLKYIDPDGEFVVALIIGAVVGAYVGGSLAAGSGGFSGANWNPFGGNQGSWKGTDWWKGAVIGGIIGAGIATGIAGIAANPANAASSSIYATSQGATTVGWNIASNALLTANINIGSSALQGRELGEIAISGLVGLAAGAIGGAIGGGLRDGGAFHKRSFTRMTSKGVNGTNLLTGGLNGFGDRFTLALYRGEETKKALLDGSKGLAEGVYLAWLGNSKLTRAGGGANFGRYGSAAAIQFGTSIPGAGIVIGTIHYNLAVWQWGYLNAEALGPLASFALYLVALPTLFSPPGNPSVFYSFTMHWSRRYLLGDGYPLPPFLQFLTLD